MFGFFFNTIDCKTKLFCSIDVSIMAGFDEQYIYALKTSCHKFSVSVSHIF